MFELSACRDSLAMLPPMVIRTRFYRVAGMPESDLDQLIAPVYTRYTNPVRRYSRAADIQIHLRARCATVGRPKSCLPKSDLRLNLLLGDRLYYVYRGAAGGVRRRHARAERGETMSVARVVQAESSGNGSHRFPEARRRYLSAGFSLIAMRRKQAARRPRKVLIRYQRKRQGRWPRRLGNGSGRRGEFRGDRERPGQKAQPTFRWARCSSGLRVRMVLG